MLPGLRDGTAAGQASDTPASTSGSRRGRLPVAAWIALASAGWLAVTGPEKLIGVVPLRYPGALRRVYPGFMQLTAFMSMNLDRHLNAFAQLYRLKGLLKDS